MFDVVRFFKVNFKCYKSNQAWGKLTSWMSLRLVAMLIPVPVYETKGIMKVTDDSSAVAMDKPVRLFN